MDLGIRGRTAIVCASSQGLGKACARALAEAGVSLVINGRNRALLDQTAEEIRQATGADVTPVVADEFEAYEMFATSDSAKSEAAKMHKPSESRAAGQNLLVNIER